MMASLVAHLVSLIWGAYIFLGQQKFLKNSKGLSGEIQYIFNPSKGRDRGSKRFYFQLRAIPSNTSWSRPLLAPKTVDFNKLSENGRLRLGKSERWKRRKGEGKSVV